MSIKHTTANTIGIKRDTTYNSSTGESKRFSKSAGGYVDNGRHSSKSGAKSSAESDIRQGPRSKGDFSKR